MIPASVSSSVQALAARAQAAKPVSGLTPLQLAELVAQGQAAVAVVDAALVDAGAALDADDPSGHPLAMIAAVRARREAVSDAVKLSDLRAFLGRAVLNLSRGVA